MVLDGFQYTQITFPSNFSRQININNDYKI